MLNKIKVFLKSLCSSGMYLPFSHDPVTKKPSVTLLFAYLSFVLALGSTVALHFKQNLLIPTLVSIMFWTVAVVFYLIRSLQKAKIDLDDRSIELESKDELKSDKVDQK